MDRKNPRKSPIAGGPPAKSRKRNKNGISKVKEEKHPVGGPDPGGGGGSNGPLGYDPQSMDMSNMSHNQGNKIGGIPDDLLMNGGDIKMENPPTPHQHSECPPDIPPLGDLGHDFPPDCKPPMGYGNCGYPNQPYNNIMPPGGDFGGPPHPGHPGSHSHGGGPMCGPPPPHMGPGGPMNYPPQPPPPQMHPHPHQQQPPPPTKQQPNTLEAPYMQQQSQLFVFSTKLANKAAEAVIQQHYPSIIAFHTSQPATRKFLEVSDNKHPFKNNNFGRQFQGNSNWPGPAPPPSSGGGKIKGSKAQQQQQQQQQQMSMPPNMQPGGPGGPPPNMPPDFNQMQGGPGAPPPPWNTQNSSKPQHQGYPNYYDGPPYGGGGPGGPQMGPCPPGGGGGGPPPGYFGGGHPNMGPMGPMPQGIKVPDENLTPQQRMHREEQLAKMKRIQQLLLPENDPHSSQHIQGVDPNNPNNFHPNMPPHENMDVYNIPGEPPPGGPMGGHMNDYNMGPGGVKHGGNEWNSPPGGGFFMDGPPQPGLKPPGPPTSGNGRPGKGSGSIPSPATPLTPSSSCGGGGGPPRPSPHSPMSGGGDGMYPGGGGGHSFYPSSAGYYSPQVGPGQEHSPQSTVQRKDSESSNSEGGGVGGGGGGKSRKEKSSCSISPTSSAPPSVKEANLMPVPSPQQIQYLNVFEGQELTIQKQPNVGLTDHNNSEHSPGYEMMPSDMNPSTPLGQQKPSQPPTPVPKSSSDMNSGNSNAKNRPGSVGPITPKNNNNNNNNNNNTTPNPSPRGLDSTSQPGTPLQMNLDGMRNNSNSSAGNTPNNNNSNNNNNNSFGPGGGLPPLAPPQMMKQGQGLPSLALDGGPGVGPDGPVFDNVPLNPNLSGPGPPPGKPAFDPISSMVQMSQQLGGNGTPPNPSGNNNGNYGMHPPPGNTQLNHNMVNFNTSLHSVQNVDGGMVMGGPQTVNNTYVNATMTIQQMNIQNIPPYMNQHGPPPNMGPMNNHQMGGHPMGGPMGGPGGQMNHMGPGGPQMGPGGGPGGMGGGPMGCGPMNMPPRMGGYPNQGPPRMGQQQGPGGGGGGCGPQGGPGGGGPPMQGRGGGGPGPYRMPPNNNITPPLNGPRPFGGTNIQVKPNAPNTIQYLPARPPPPHNQGGGPGSGMCSPSMMGGPGNPPGRTGPNLDFLQRYTNPSPGPVVNVNMGMNVSVGMGNRMQYPPQMGPNGPIMGNNGQQQMCGGPMRGPPMMDQQGHGPMGGGPMGGGGGGMGPGPGQMPPQMMGGPPNGPGGMKGYGQQQQQQGPNGPGGGGGPQPSDPAYAQQFHHFQQQLYATSSNNGRNSMQGNMPPNNPNQPPPNQQFFNY